MLLLFQTKWIDQLRYLALNYTVSFVEKLFYLAKMPSYKTERMLELRDQIAIIFEGISKLPM